MRDIWGLVVTTFAESAMAHKEEKQSKSHSHISVSHGCGKALKKKGFSMLLEYSDMLEMNIS